MSSPGTITVPVPPASGWRRAVAHLGGREQRLILGGSLIMLAGSVTVAVLNFAFNVAVARTLGPANFGHISAAVTLLMLASAITLSFQLVGAKFIARNGSGAGKLAVFRSLQQRAWLAGIAIGGGLALASPWLAAALRMPSPWLLVLMGVAIAVYVPVGVRRGYFHGECQFPRLAGNFVVEAAVRLLAALILVLVGWGVFGAVGAIVLSVVAAYLLPPVRLPSNTGAGELIPPSMLEGTQAIAFFVGKVIINNIDVLLVKHFFPPAEAGIYAAVALVGRVLAIMSWQVVSAMFPVSAANTKDDRRVLIYPMLMVLGLTAAFILGALAFSTQVIGGIFGTSFAAGIGLMPIYAATAGAYTLAVVLMTYEMSRKVASASWIQLAFSALVVLAIALFHASLKQVIAVQLALMLAMIVAVSIPFLRGSVPAQASEEVPA
jgi:O-antigen/teichoic acid export membrane protein